MTAKSGFAYREMFSAIKEQADEQGIRLKVDTLRTVFETAAIDAAKDVLSIEKVEGCFFHLSQAHWRKLQDLGLRTTYIADEEFAQSARMLSALAFCPPDDIIDNFNLLKENLPDELEPMIDYIEKTYIGYYSFKSKVGRNGLMVRIYMYINYIYIYYN